MTLTKLYSKATETHNRELLIECFSSPDIKSLFEQSKDISFDILYTVFSTNDLQLANVLLNNDSFDPSIYSDRAICLASNKGHVEMTNLLMKDKRVDPSANDDYCIAQAGKKTAELVLTLMNDSRVNPSSNLNQSIRDANSRGYNDIVFILWKDQRVKDTLKNHDFKLYSKIKASEVRSKIIGFK
jgi:hypothetical protein